MAMSNRGKKEDAINHPTHYTQGYCETIYEIYDILGPEGFKAYCLGNWIKYKSRAQYKNGEEDLKKADVYLGWATQGLPRPADDKYFKMEVESNSVDARATFSRPKCDGNHGEPRCNDPECWLK